MNPTASYRNIYLSIEKFLWDGLASTENKLLLNQDDIGSRLEELETAGCAIVWRPASVLVGNTGSMRLFAGATYIKDPGNVNLITLFDKVKNLFDVNGGIPVYQYTGDTAGNQVNGLAFVGGLQIWPIIPEPNGFKSMLLSQKLLFGQKVV